MKNSYLGIIVARKGSKGIKNKNFLLINKKENKRVIDYTLQSAKQSRKLNSIILSSNDERILNIAKKYDLDMLIRRSSKLSDDKSKTVDAVIDAVRKFEKKFYKPKFVVLLQPTSPLRKSKHIDESINFFNKNNKKYNSLVSVSEYHGTHPFKLKKIVKNYIKPFIDKTDSEKPRQSMPKVYKLNGLIYIIKSAILIKKKTFFNLCVPYFIEEKYSLNLDNYEDLAKLKKNI
jgi:CMP-N-acetylneuraminic acid synthetase